MKSALILLAAGLGLAACTEAKTSPEDLCLTMSAGDVSVHESLKEDMVDRYDYCGCFGAHVEAMDLNGRATIEKVIQTVIDIRGEKSLSVKDAADLIFADQDGVEYGISVDEIEYTGKFLDGLQDDMAVMSGACPTPSSVEF